METTLHPNQPARSLRIPALLTGLLLAVLPAALAADSHKANNSDDLNLPSSWVEGQAPASGDVAVWDATVASASTTSLGADTNWSGIKISNPGGDVALNSGNTLTLGAGGVNMSSATVNLSLGCDLMLGASQTWSVAGGRSLTVGGTVGSLVPPTTLTKSGPGLLTLGGANTYTGNLTISQGLLAIDYSTALGANNSLTLGDAASGTNAIQFLMGINASGTLALDSVNTTSNGTNQTITLNGNLPLGTLALAVSNINLNGNRPLTIQASTANGHSGKEEIKVHIAGNGVAPGNTALILAGSTSVNTPLIVRWAGDSSPANNFTGDVILQGWLQTYGRIDLGFDAANQNLGFTNNNVTLAPLAVWQIWAGAETIGALNGAGNIEMVAQNGDTIGLTVGNNNASGSAATIIGSQLAPYGLLKVGTGTQTLSAINPYTGPTLVSNGVLNITGQLTGGGAVTVADGVTMNVTGKGAAKAISGPGDFTLGDSGTSTLGFSSLSSTTVAPISTANLLVNNTTAINISGTMPVGQFPLIQYVSLSGAGSFMLGSVPAGNMANLVTNTVNNSIDLNVTAAPVIILTNLATTNLSRFAGLSVTLSVVAGGTGPLTYLWTRNGLPVGGNSPTLSLTGLTTNDSGSYQVQITNVSSSAVSSTATLVVQQPSGYDNLVFATGPFAYWPLNETAGPTATDWIGGYNGAYINNPTNNVDGPNGNRGASFNGDANPAPCVRVPYAAALNPSAFTAELWAKPFVVPYTNTPFRYLISSSIYTATRYGWYLGQDNNSAGGLGVSGFGVRLFNQNGSTPTITLTAPISQVAWYHLVLTYDGTTASFYTNGFLAAQGAAAFVTNRSGNFAMGARDGVLGWPGAMSAVALYSRALTAGEIQTHAQNAPSNLQITSAGSDVVLNWVPGSGGLQAATDITGVYTNVPATAPYTNTPSASSQFWRLKY